MSDLTHIQYECVQWPQVREAIIAGETGWWADQGESIEVGAGNMVCSLIKEGSIIDTRHWLEEFERDFKQKLRKFKGST